MRESTRWQAEESQGLLSEEELSALLQRLPGDDSRGRTGSLRTVQEYDFRHPDKLSKEQARTLQMLHESFARLSGLALSAALRTTVQVNLVSTEQMAYEEYVEQVPEPSVLYLVRPDPLPSNVVIEFSVDFALAVVDRLLGGAGSKPAKVRDITDIEVSLLGHIAGDILASFRDAWANIVELSPELEDTLLVSRFAKVALPTDVVMVASFEGRISTSKALVRVCIPFAVLEPILPRLSAQLWFARVQRVHKGETASLLQAHMREVRLLLTARLGVADIEVEELMRVRPGDVIRLESGPERDAQVLLNGCPTYRGRPGLKGKRLAIQVTGLVAGLEEGEGENG